jgi:ribosomal protein S18 acetylase RimI-like enzyme
VVERAPGIVRPMGLHGRAGRLRVGTLLALEARAHRWPRRTIREILGGWLVHDPDDHEPVFNRLVDPVLPDAETDFDDWLRAVREVFDRIARRPHLWLTAPFDDSRIGILERAGFGQVGASRYMYLDTPSSIELAAPASTANGVAIERVDMTTPDRLRAARDVAAVIADAFELDPAFHVLIEADVVEMLEVPAISFVLARVQGEAVAVARRTTDGRASLLAAIGTRRGYRTRGFGRLVTATATQDALAAGSETVFLGVEDGNDAARHLYERLGYAFADGGVTALLQR